VPSLDNLLITYFQDGVQKYVFAKINSPLEKLIFASQKLRDALDIGLDWNSLVFYVLAGIRPFVPPIDLGMAELYVYLPSGRTVKYREAEI
jgi:hypothetical protein